VTITFTGALWYK